MDVEAKDYRGYLSTAALRTRGLLRHKLLVEVIHLPMVYPALLIQTTLCVLGVAVLDRGDVAALLRLLVDLVALLSFGVLHQTMPKFLAKYDELMLRALPIMEDLEGTASRNLTMRANESLKGARVQFFSLLVCHLGATICILLIPLLTGDTFYQFWLPANINRKAFLAKYALQVYSFVPCMTCVVIYQQMHAASVAGLEAMFRHLTNHIRIIGSELPEALTVDKLSQLHSELTRLAVGINKLFSWYLLSVFWAGGALAMVCALWLLLGGVESRVACMIVFSPVSYLWICLLGERLRKASEEVSEAVYFSDWLSRPVRERKMLLFMMQRAYRPEAVIVPLIGPMTLSIFMSSVTFWYNNVMMMRKVLEKKH